MDSIITDLKAIEIDYTNHINELKESLLVKDAEISHLKEIISTNQLEIQELTSKVTQYTEIEDELHKLRLFKETIISGLAERSVEKSNVKNGHVSFKKAQEELNQNDYSNLVSKTKEFNAKSVSKQELLKFIKSICSHELYLDFVDLMQ